MDDLRLWALIGPRAVVPSSIPSKGKSEQLIQTGVYFNLFVPDNYCTRAAGREIGRITHVSAVDA